MKTKLILLPFICASLLLTAGRAHAQWVTYWDYIRNAGTSPTNVATMVAITAGVSQTASLTNFATGVTLPGVSVTMTNVSSPNGGTTGSPLAGTPAYVTFNTFVDFTGGGVEVAGAAVHGLVISGLNPARTYSFSGTACRGNTPYTGRWTRSYITNVVSFVAAHTPGVITNTVGGTVLTPDGREGAWNSGRNHEAGQGDMVVWTNIVPNASGQIVVISRIYNNTAPGVATDTKGYAIAGFRLEEVAPAVNSITLSTPANGTAVGAPAVINLTASASAAVPETVSSVAYYYTNSGGETFVGSSIAGTTYPVATAALPLGSYGFYAVMTNSAGATAFSQTNVVTVVPPLASLTFLQQPSEQLVGAVIAPEIQVGATNSLGDPMINVPVTLSLTGQGLLGGTLTQNTDGSGIAHFANLTVSAVGTKTLTATNAGSGIFGTSSSFSITNLPSIEVGLGGSGVITFDTLPTVQQWSSFSNPGAQNATRTDAQWITLVNVNNASAISTVLGSQAAPGSSGNAYWRNDIGRIATQPTGNAGTLLMATLKNVTGGTIDTLDINYEMSETVPLNVNEVHRGHRVFYSTSGLPSTWTFFGSITNLALSTNNVSFSLNALGWTAGSLLYVIWADENGVSPDGDWAIDNISFTPPAVNTVTLTSPGNGILAGAPAIVNLTALAIAAAGESVSSVAYYYTNSGGETFVGSSAAGATYPVSTAGLPIGSYGFYAVMTNSSGATAFSQTNVVTVIPPLASLTFLQQPSDQLAGAAIAPEIQVGATNSLGEAVVGLPINLSLTGGGVLGGTTTQNTDGSGIAHFANLTVSTVGPKTLVATNAGSGIFGTSASFTITNAPPSVALTTPPGDFLVGTSVTLAATATDTDGTVSSVTFYSSGRLLGSDTTSPFELRFHDLRTGTHSVVAVALDNSGNNATSAPVSINVTNEPGYTYLITNGAPWKYLDTGLNLGDSASGTNYWIESSFDDSAWSIGQGELGYGNNTENPTRPAATTILFGPDPNNKFVTTYFRKQFTVADPSTFTNLVLKLIRDDGALIHINSNEVVRIGLPAGAIANTTLANAGPPDEAAFETYNIGVSNLVSGLNIIAVEIHQASLNSSDLSFDLQLLAQGNVPLSILSTVYDANNDQLILTWNSAPGAVYAIDNVQDITTPRALWDTLTGGIASQGTTTSFAIDAPYAGTFYSIRKE